MEELEKKKMKALKINTKWENFIMKNINKSSNLLTKIKLAAKNDIIPYKHFAIIEKISNYQIH